MRRAPPLEPARRPPRFCCSPTPPLAPAACCVLLTRRRCFAAAAIAARRCLLLLQLLRAATVVRCCCCGLLLRCRFPSAQQLTTAALPELAELPPPAARDGEDEDDVGFNIFKILIQHFRNTSSIFFNC